jgi:CheY-like chemotaxis protein
MPVMDGMISTKEIRSRVAPEYQPQIVALTAQAMRGDRLVTHPLLHYHRRLLHLCCLILYDALMNECREECLAAGMNDYITKPVNKAELLRIISEVPRLAANSNSSTNNPSTVSTSTTPQHQLQQGTPNSSAL